MANDGRGLLWPELFHTADDILARCSERWQKQLASNLLAEGIVRAQLRYELFHERLLTECESPIERLFAAAWVQLVPHAESDGRVLGDQCRRLTEIGPRLGQLLEIYRTGSAEGGRLFAIFPQIEVAEFRADFLAVATSVERFTSGEWVQVVVECDGHDFHERTKEQAAQDRARDRRLQGLGFPVLRFTGSEIYRDADGCARSLARFLGERLTERCR